MPGVATDKPKTRSPRITKIKIKEPDDYHATLKALNSKGRMPRKALGQNSDSSSSEEIIADLPTTSKEIIADLPTTS
ncbi:Ribosomal RNA adenine methylase transferase [Artemisia annua]|uniref:Ribosomal RNA adenine methylase transferase n=1 Tax=Artemisia annua TaxID=35608 RepID=A0A2U1P4V9_ARTAN|nr:Ribosomal RNA adenine methylase transferase [Artemisia annua]